MKLFVKPSIDKNFNLPFVFFPGSEKEQYDTDGERYLEEVVYEGMISLEALYSLKKHNIQYGVIK